MRRARSWAVVATAAALVLLAACGSDGTAASGSSPADDEATTTVITAAPVPAGFPPVVVTATIGNNIALPVLSVVDTSTGVSRQLVDVADLAPAFGFTPTNASVYGMDISPDGSTLAFSAYAGSPPIGATRVFTVPLDGSAPASPLAAIADDDANSYTWSPDGRWLAVYDGALRLVPMESETAATVRRGIQLPYPPGAVVWGPDSTWFLELPHGERTDCPDPIRVAVDPTTGTMTGAMTEEPSSSRTDACTGAPWIDQRGTVHTTSTAQVLGTDPTGRFVLGVTTVQPADPGSPDATWTQELVWWEAQDSAPRPVPLGIVMGPAAFTAGW